MARPSMSLVPNIDYGPFVADVTRFVNKSKSNIDKVVRKAVLRVFRDIVTTTPVDTGRLRSGWQAGKNYSAESQLAGNYALTKSGKPARKWSSGANFGRGAWITKGFGRFESGQATVKREQPNIESFTVQDGIIGYIYNNVHYGIYIEYGHGQNPPGCMVRNNIKKFINYCNEEASKVNK